MPRLHSQWGAWRADGLRMRFRPRSRIGQGFLMVVPWVDCLFVLVLFLALGHRLLLRPGIVFELPQAPFREGVHHGLTVVMLVVDRPKGPETLVFFDDIRYELSNAAEMEQLRSRVGSGLGQPGGRQLLLLADRRVPHGDVVALVNLARETGIQRVSVTVKPE